MNPPMCLCGAECWLLHLRSVFWAPDPWMVLMLDVMTMPDSSPPPWIATFKYKGGYDGLSSGYEVRAGEQLIVTVDVNDYVDSWDDDYEYDHNLREHPVAGANARLIAAAPRLLAALTALVIGDAWRPESIDVARSLVREMGRG